jgi:NAD-dependent deacetylase
MPAKGRIFVLTGAGISAESGIPVFQGTNWRGHSHYDLANIDAWECDPALVWQYYSDRRASARHAKPNAAHIALAEWTKELGAASVFLCTQNVDGLHEAAGSNGVVHIHGKLFESRCAADCGQPAFADQKSYSADDLPRCSCGALARPNVCWFGEQPYHLDRIYHELESCSTFMAIGTSGSVQPVASFVGLLKQRRSAVPTVYAGVEAPANAGSFNQVHLGIASQIVPNVLRSLSKVMQ